MSGLPKKTRTQHEDPVNDELKPINSAATLVRPSADGWKNMGVLRTRFAHEGLEGRITGKE